MVSLRSIPGYRVCQRNTKLSELPCARLPSGASKPRNSYVLSSLKCERYQRHTPLVCAKNKSTQGWKAVSGKSAEIPILGIKSKPRIMFSSSKKEYDWREATSSWELSEIELRDFEAFQKLISDKTTLVISAYTMEADEDDDLSSPPPKQGRSWWSGAPGVGHKGSHRKVIAGYVWAKCDDSFVATVHGLYVCPRFRGRGLGKKLMKRVTKAVMKKGIVDIGLLPSQESSAFFRKCDFDEDRDGAVTVTFNPLALPSFLGNPNAKHLLKTEALENQLDDKWR